MSKDPAFLFYPNDWIGGTMGMTLEEKGAYMEVLILQFNRGHMTSHMIGQVLGHMTSHMIGQESGQTGGQIWEKIKDKFTQDGKGRWYNERLEEEITKRKSFVESRKNNRKGVNQYTKKQGHVKGHMTTHMTSHMENENINRDINNNIDNTIEGGVGGSDKNYLLNYAEKVFNAYPMRSGRLTALKSIMTAFEIVEPEVLLNAVKGYAASYARWTPKAQKQYVMKPETYFNGGHWDDDLRVYNRHIEEKKEIEY